MKKQLKRIVKFTDDYTNEERMILRDHLAMERTKLANERTLLSYVRSSLYLLLGGIGLVGIKQNLFEDLKVVGLVAIGLSVLFLAVGIIRYIQLKGHLRQFK